MGVYIKDLKKPEDCDVCPIHLVFTTCGCDRDHCMFQEVPEQHGRLGDLDALKVSLAFAKETAKWSVPLLRTVLMIVDKMPTIIPASEDGET